MATSPDPPVTPALQTTFGHGRGNCVAACWATLLDLPIESVPDLTGGGVTDGESAASLRQHEAEGAFAESHGFGLLMVPANARPGPCFRPFDGWLHMASGKSPRGLSHRVVMRDGALVHDPHPDGGGLVDVDLLIYVVALDPGRWARNERAMRAAMGAYVDSDPIGNKEQTL